MKFAFLFPGQGSQKIGMGSTFKDSSHCKTIFKLAEQKLEFDLQKLCWEGAEEELTLSKNAQPAILAVSTIAYLCFKEKHSLLPDYLAGHSLGEYSALVAAGVLDFSDAVFAVHKRGEFMQEAVASGVGAMAAILGKTDEEVTQLCKEISTEDCLVAPANFNCPGQVVISGHKEAVLQFLEKAKGKLLQVSAPFHCPLMHPVREKFSKVLDTITFNDATIPIVNNVSASLQKSANSFKASLLEQIDSPVLWNDSIKMMVKSGVNHFVEFGEGKILTGLLKRIDKKAKTSNISNLDQIKEFIQC